MSYNKEQIIEMCKKIHGNKYDYSITESVQNKLSKIKYICPIHGIKEQTFYNHLQGKGCNECSKKKCGAYHKFTNETFLEKAEKKHNLENYDWTDFNINNRDNKGKVEFCCKKHGKYWDWPSNFIKGHGCHVCYGKEKNDEEVKKELSELHPELIFSETKFSEHDAKYRIKVICPKHGELWISYYNLINGQGCYYCGREKTAFKNTITNEEFIRRGKNIFGDEYTYEHLDTYNRDEEGKVIVTCKKHGDFKITPDNFFHGVGCAKCSESNIEGEIRRFLEKNKIEFEAYKKFEWLGKQHIDFYLPKYNIGIECQGEQHFKPVNIFGGEEGFIKIIKLDFMKKKLCDENGVKLLYYSNKKHDFPYKIFNKKEKLLEEIKRD